MSAEEAPPQPGAPPVETPPPPLRGRLDTWCAGCSRRHGFGWCGYARRLTDEHLARRGAHFNWR